MQRLRVNWFPILLGSLFIALISIPYLWAYQNSGDTHWFGGFLFNPIDGNSYLAKMYQGWGGNWRFYLPYTADPGEGGYLFLFYLALGHFARISGGSNQLIFHLARIASSVALVASLWYFFGKIFSHTRTKMLAFGLALFGSGMGWIVSVFGILSADFWVAEGYPFLSAYANPHFPLGIAIMLWIMAPTFPESSKADTGLTTRMRFQILVAGISLAVIMPFGVVIAGTVLAGLIAWDLWEAVRRNRNERAPIHSVVSVFSQSEAGQKLVYLILGSAPVLIYQVWVTNSDPVLAAWSAQNLTASPPFWELLIAYSPILLVALTGTYIAVKTQDQRVRTLLLWAGLGLLLLYLPWSLQRRFISGFMVPLAGLAAIGLDRLFSKKRIIGVAVLILLIVLNVPTNLMIILGGVQAIQAKEEKISLSQDEYQALMWLENNTDPEAVILAGPEMGLFIPAYTGRRVWYGHPFETTYADRMESLVVNFFSGAGQLHELEQLMVSDYLFYGSRERSLGEFQLDSRYELVYESGDIRIYRID